MDTIQEFENKQEAERLQSKITSFFNDFKIGSILNVSGILKLRGISPIQVLMSIFILPFENNNFYRGIVTNDRLNFQKDVAYDLLKNPCHNWRKLHLKLAIKAACFFDLLTSEKREKALIIDDSTYDRSRSKKVELLARIFDHNTKTYFNGFKLLTLGWSDGFSFLPLDFVMRSSAKALKRLQEITKKKLDKRTCGYKRRAEAMLKTTEVLGDMVNRVLKAGLSADYILMDSWFCFPVIITQLHAYLPVICMAKNLKNIHYIHENTYVTLAELYNRVKKRPGKARIKASVITTMRGGPTVKIVFVRHRGKKTWLAILSTRIDMPDEEILRVYGIRWDIEVFFKMMKHYLNMEKETQFRDYDKIIGHTTIAMARYIFLAYQQRLSEDPRTLGTLFYACCGEVKDLNVFEALTRILSLALKTVRSSKEFAENVVNKMIDAVMGSAVEVLKAYRQAASFLLEN